jgi:RNA polymerase sigma-70 factor (ECF subfamily)
MLVQLRALPLEQREVLVLVAVEQLSYPEIAALLHLPVATVIARLSHAREALRSSSPKPLSAPNSAK